MSSSEIYIQATTQVSAARNADFPSGQHQLSAFSAEDNRQVGRLHLHFERQLQQLLQEHPTYSKLDRSVQLALLTAQKLQAKLPDTKQRIGINIGSSRGATESWEREYQNFTQQGSTSIAASPTTSLGNISSWVGQFLHLNAMPFSHSMTCSTSLLSVLNGMAWLRAGMADIMLVGGAEASLTPFTLAQLQAMRLYGRDSQFPSQAGNFVKKANAMILGEAAALAILTTNPQQSIAKIAGIGMASEPIHSPTYISQEATHLQHSMQAALQDANLSSVDVVVSHTPGTLHGDRAEKHAIQHVLGHEVPITNNKWQIGHTFGASGIMSLVFALEMFRINTYIPTPFTTGVQPKTLQHILINATGFGGNAVSIILQKTN
ncbi:MAG: beta-ketoacyl synthase N-terminal-like domain-containing protein [Weeksellaceae bacterium]|nr:beta-ketoacyl synthase N-terminal-like domain-containing protein [Weeksellaceae bacterium]